jgi:hypothetical protein
MSQGLHKATILSLLVLSQHVFAQQITSVTVSQPYAVVGQTIQATIDFSGSTTNLYCGLLVSLGDGSTLEIRASEKDLPIKLEHKFGQPGSYSITVEGKFITRGFKSAGACSGKVISAPIVVATEPPPGVAAPEDPQRAKNEEADLRKAADRGDTNAMYQLGNIAAQQGNNVEAIRWFKSASDRGNAKASNALAFMYDDGRGVPQNFEQASKLYLKAIRKGDPFAMINRGNMFAQGRGIAPDPLQAYVNYLLAAGYAQDAQTRDEALRLRDQTASKLSSQHIVRGQAIANKFAKDEIRLSGAN